MWMLVWLVAGAIGASLILRGSHHKAETGMDWVWDFLAWSALVFFGLCTLFVGLVITLTRGKS